MKIKNNNFWERLYLRVAWVGLNIWMIIIVCGFAFLGGMLMKSVFNEVSWYNVWILIFVFFVFFVIFFLKFYWQFYSYDLIRIWGKKTYSQKFILQKTLLFSFLSFFVSLTLSVIVFIFLTIFNIF